MRGVGAALLLFALSLPLSCAPGTSTADSLQPGMRTLAQQMVPDLRDRGVTHLAVLEFTTSEGETTGFETLATEELIDQLHAAAPGVFTLVERRRLEQVRQEQALTASRFFDPDSLVNVGKVLGADAMVVASTHDLDHSVRVHASVIAVETAEVISRTSVTILKPDPVQSLLVQQDGLTPGTHPGNGSPPWLRSLAGSGSADPKVWHNEFLRLTADLVTVQSDGKKANLAVTLTNRTQQALYLALDKGSYCDFALVDNTGSYSRTGSNRITGIACVDGETADQEPTESFTLLSPGSTTTVLVKTHFLNAIDGDRLSFSADFLRRHDGKTSSFSAGLSNLPFHREAEAAP